MPSFGRPPIRDWEIVGTDSYKLARIPLTVTADGDDEALIAGPISADALKAIEKAGHFRANGTIEPCSENGVPLGQSFAREDPATAGQYPNVEQLMPDPDTLAAFTIGLDARFLMDLAESFGGTGRHRHNVKLSFCTTNGEPSNLRPMIVEPLGSGGEGAGILMPVRVTAP